MSSTPEMSDLDVKDARVVERSSSSDNAGEKHHAPHDDVGYIEASESAGWDTAATKRLMRKIDFTLIPFLALLYLLSFLDRTNIGNARLDTLEKDLHLSKEKLQYNAALSIFFPFYVAAEIPSNMAMKRFRPSIWIPSIMIAWAVCTTLLGVVHNYAGLMACRAALGIAEGGLFPGITY